MSAIERGEEGIEGIGRGSPPTPAAALSLSLSLRSLRLTGGKGGSEAATRRTARPPVKEGLGWAGRRTSEQVYRSRPPPLLSAQWSA